MYRWWCALALFVACNVVVWSAAQRRAAAIVPASAEAQAPARGSAPGTDRSPYSHEQDWIATDVASAVVALARAAAGEGGARVTAKVETASGPIAISIDGGELLRLPVERQLWMPETYLPLAAGLANRNADAAGADLDVRGPLTDLRVEVLLDQHHRLSRLLTVSGRSAAAHESAAMILGAYALREHAGRFSDVRPALNRMTAHLTIARALRGTAPVTPDGTFARAILTLLTGLQREALGMVDAIERTSSAVTDRAWVRALRLRATRDWRTPVDPRSSTLLEQFEYAAAVDGRRGSDELLDYLDTFQPAEVTDWARMGLTFAFSVEAGHRFTRSVVRRELAEANLVWTRLRKSTPAEAELVGAMNELPASPVRRDGQTAAISVLDWDLWAGFHQRHLLHTLNSSSSHLGNAAGAEPSEEFTREVTERFAGLRLFPFVLRTLTSDPAAYLQSVNDGRQVVANHPELVTAAAWNVMANGKRSKEEAFPFFVEWFEPAVPHGTAFDLDPRALLPGCPRPPTREQARLWAVEAPYDHWTVWSSAYYSNPRDSRPPYAVVKRGFGALLDYDFMAVEKVIDWMEMPMAERIANGRRLCAISAKKCYRLADMLLADRQEDEAARVYEQWARNARNRVAVSNNLTWLVRRYQATGRAALAEEIARMGSETGSYAGLETLAHLLDRQGRFDEAQRLYTQMAERYGHKLGIGTFELRQALRAGDRARELKAWDLLRRAFPDGLQRAGLYALEATPVDGIVFGFFGRRAAATGLRATDVVIGVDGWRVRNSDQYGVIARLRHEDEMKFLVWRDRRYQELTLRVPERWLGVPIVTYRGTTGHPPQQ